MQRFKLAELEIATATAPRATRGQLEARRRIAETDQVSLGVIGDGLSSSGMSFYILLLCDYMTVCGLCCAMPIGTSFRSRCQDTTNKSVKCTRVCRVPWRSRRGCAVDPQHEPRQAEIINQRGVVDMSPIRPRQRLRDEDVAESLHSRLCQPIHRRRPVVK